MTKFRETQVLKNSLLVYPNGRVFEVLEGQAPPGKLLGHIRDFRKTEVTEVVIGWEDSQPVYTEIEFRLRVWPGEEPK